MDKKGSGLGKGFFSESRSQLLSLWESMSSQSLIVHHERIYCAFIQITGDSTSYAWSKHKMTFQTRGSCFMENTKSLNRKKSGSSGRHRHSNSLRDTTIPTQRSEGEDNSEERRGRGKRCEKTWERSHIRHLKSLRSSQWRQVRYLSVNM